MNASSFRMGITTVTSGGGPGAVLTCALRSDLIEGLGDPHPGVPALARVQRGRHDDPVAVLRVLRREPAPDALAARDVLAALAEPVVARAGHDREPAGLPRADAHDEAVAAPHPRGRLQRPGHGPRDPDADALAPAGVERGRHDDPVAD